MVSICPFMRALFSFVPAKQKKDWQTIAWESKEATFQTLIRAEQRHHQSEQKYYREHEAKSLLDYKFGALQKDMLCLQNNFNLRGALEFSLDEYKKTHKVPETSRMLLLHHLLKDQVYQTCLSSVTEHFQLRKEDVNSCARALYHELSKHAHGNTAELVVRDSEHTMTEVAALKAVFCALKAKGCFHLPVKISVSKQEHEL
ncbi:hypothetical protein EDB89DRAFT_698171 [Lactarius sanguifluus]|nr:hypothetical protein EDB89DRAFT_698171 [Lactarius sanguifluus]